MHATGKAYLPVAGKDWLLPFYDPFTKLLGVEARVGFGRFPMVIAFHGASLLMVQDPPARHTTREKDEAGMATARR